MDIATKLSWEIVALNDRGAEGNELLAVKIAYGVALKIDDPAQFQAIMASIIGQVTSTDLQASLRKIVARVAK